ncbi:MAG: hypothetical protein F6J87_08395 [Spirulina sp. SIO3F2]|nr:hypothetical protein [Spirulina sp. SIO3F2]
MALLTRSPARNYNNEQSYFAQKPMTPTLEQRQQIHQLVEQLPSETLQDAIQLLQGLSNRAARVAREAELLAVVQRCLPPSQQERWAVLRGKLAEETLTEREHQEFLTYSDLLELWNAERVEAVMELAQLRGVEFKVLYQELTPQSNL